MNSSTASRGWKRPKTHLSVHELAKLATLELGVGLTTSALDLKFRLARLQPTPAGTVPAGWADRMAEQATLLSKAPGLAPYVLLVERLADFPPHERGESELVDMAAEIAIRPGFDVLVSLNHLGFEPFPHQIEAATVVLRRMRGRAILADEVGLGKTIEAGLILNELRLRRLIARALVLVPPGLLEQWQAELVNKFGLPLTALHDSWAAAGGGQIILGSLATARREGYRHELTSVEWDLVVVDEAHRLKNPHSASSRLVRELRTRYLLLLTATPVENRLNDVYQLANLVRPGLLGSPSAFRSRHPVRAGEPARLEELRAALRQVMVRHRRSEVRIQLPARLAETLRIAPNDDERRLYRDVTERVREEARIASPSAALGLRALLRLAGSHPGLLTERLRQRGWPELADRSAGLVRPRKAEVLLDLLQEEVGRREKVAVFTAFRETLEFLVREALRAGLPIASYHGGLSRREKEAAVAAFREELPVLITTEAAGEGRNLQFCHQLINFDLPWNPMQIEQRLGRFHRIGQEHEVLVRSLVAAGTLEDRILGVLESKINLFELVVGELDMILGHLEEDFDFEAHVFQAHAQSRDDEELQARLESLGEEIRSARGAYQRSRSLSERLEEVRVS